MGFFSKTWRSLTAACSPSRALQPKAEAEVAIIMGRDLVDPQATAEDVFGAASRAVAAIEAVDSRIEDWKITFADTVADNGSSAFYVLGREDLAAARG